jgi:hypothetical protein
MTRDRRPGRRKANVFVACAIAALGCRRSHLPPRPDGAPVVLAPETSAENGLTVVGELEPNDLLANAQLLSLVASPVVGVAGHLLSAPGSRAKDVDIYRIIVPPPAVIVAGPDSASSPPRQIMSVSVQPESSLVVSIDALDDQGKVLVADVGNSAGEVEGIPNLSVMPGTYFVRVKPGIAGSASASSPVSVPTGASATSGANRHDVGLPGGSAYRLTIRLLPVEAGDEIEPNGKATFAGDVAAGGDVAGFLGWRHDEDWFRLPMVGLPEGSVLSVDLDVPTGVAASLAVYDSVEHKMIEQRGRKGDRVAIRNVRLPSSEPNMFVVIRAEAGRNLDTRYTLHLRTEEARADSELEPNDDPAHAVPLVDGTILGYLGPGDTDVYRYSSAMPVELDFEAIPPEHVDLKVEVIREDGTVVTRVDSGKRREAERLPNLFVSGSLLLRLSAGKGDGNLDEPYRITASSRPVEPSAEREPNGTVALATVLSVGTIGTGLCYPRGDLDYWLAEVPVAPGGSLAVSVRGVTGLTLDVRVQTTAGKDLGHFRVGGESSAPTRVSPAGATCCLIEIREASGRGANPRDRYSLSVLP